MSQHRNKPTRILPIEAVGRDPTGSTVSESKRYLAPGGALAQFLGIADREGIPQAMDPHVQFLIHS